ncbi:Metacaspase-1B [Madurella mycetomatis]|uniref:Metacaspase-1B n=1 Tax=Madurella mycetomatis TaxID=100816 RepID=A0A175W211_9PEZI|nr:Metacaspase-1B [Madurella mycetomatis]
MTADADGDRPTALPAENGRWASTDADWEGVKDAIVQLYWEEDRCLPEVMGIMATRHNFHATEKQYKYRFEKWKLEKYVSQTKMSAVSRIRNKRCLNEQKETEFSLRGRPIPPEKIDRWEKRHNPAEEQAISPNGSIAASTPSGITYRTPGSLVFTPPARDPTSPGEPMSPQHADEDDSRHFLQCSLVSIPSSPSPPFTSRSLSRGLASDFPQHHHDSYSQARSVLPSAGVRRTSGYEYGYGSGHSYPRQDPQFHGYQQPPGPAYGYHQSLPPQGYHPPQPPPNNYGRPSEHGLCHASEESHTMTTAAMPTVNSNSYIHGNHSAPPPPPQATQHYGHGSYGLTFQHSQCTGRRKALLIGINYFNQRGQLKGCINDVRNMSAYLVENFGYKYDDMVILMDDQQNLMSQPTKQNILRAMHWLVKDARPNDSLFFHYSGHGDRIKDLDGDGEDGYDEIIYPVDFRQNGHITDDEMHRIMVRPLQAGVRLTVIFDSCHSATTIDLPYIYSTQGILKEPNLAKEAGQGLLGVVSCNCDGLGGVANNIMDFLKKASGGQDVYARFGAVKTSVADVILFSGRNDSQTSVDATIASQETGAMSWALITALKKNPQQSYVQLLGSIRDELQTRYNQKPQLSCSHPLGKLIIPNTLFHAT